MRSPKRTKFSHVSCTASSTSVEQRRTRRAAALTSPWKIDDQFGECFRIAIEMALNQICNFFGCGVRPHARTKPFRGRSGHAVVRVTTRNSACWCILRSVAESIALFASLPERERAALEARCRRLKVPAQAYLYHEGQVGRRRVRVVSGRIGIWSGGERGDPVLLAILGPGEMFGEMAILSDERVRTAAAQALSKVEVIQILRTRHRGVAPSLPAHLRRLHRGLACGW